MKVLLCWLKVIYLWNNFKLVAIYSIVVGENQHISYVSQTKVLSAMRFAYALLCFIFWAEFVLFQEWLYVLLRFSQNRWVMGVGFYPHREQWWDGFSPAKIKIPLEVKIKIHEKWMTQEMKNRKVNSLLKENCISMV